MLKFAILIVYLALSVVAAKAQSQPAAAANEKPAAPQTAKKANARHAAESSAAEPYDKASVETLAAQCVRFETDAGVIEMEMLAETAPVTVRNFLNLVAIKAFDTTTFSRVVPNFIVQGGDLATREKMTAALAKRALRTIPDEPNIVRHARGIVSMARGDAPNSASTNFFFLVGDAPHLDTSFAAFGRVTNGMDVVDAVNKMPMTGDKPTKPVRLTRATAAPCPAQTEPKSLN